MIRCPSRNGTITAARLLGLGGLAELLRAEPRPPRLVLEVGDQQRLSPDEHLGQPGPLDRLHLAGPLLLGQGRDLLEATVRARLLDPADVDQGVRDKSLGGLGEAPQRDLRIELAADDLAGDAHQPVELTLAGTVRVRP